MNTVKNIGWFYQKQYFKGIRFDADKKDVNNINEIKRRNKVLSDSDEIDSSLYYKSENFFKAKSVYPGIITGIGMTHETGIEGELKLGMYFDYSTGQPCVPSSSIKGAVREAFPQWDKHKDTPAEIKRAKAFVLCDIIGKKMGIPAFIIEKKFEDCHDKEPQFLLVKQLENEIFDGRNFNEENKDADGKQKEYLSVYEKDIFHDAFILEGDKRGKILEDDAITVHQPNLLKNPTPVLFLKILSGVTLQFNFDVKNGTVLTATQKLDLFDIIIKTFGIGAKTNVGYGQLVATHKQPAQVAEDRPEESGLREAGPFLKKDNSYSGKISMSGKKYVQIEFTVNGNPVKIVKAKKDKLADATVGQEVKIIVQKTYSPIDGLTCSVKPT